MKHHLLADWYQNKVTQLMFELLEEYKKEAGDVILNSQEIYSDAGCKNIARLIGQCQLIEQLKEVEEFFPSEKLEQIGEE